MNRTKSGETVLLEWMSSLWTTLAVFAAATAVIGFVGWRLARVADTLADRTGLGEAVMGAAFLGVGTSLPGIVTTVSTSMTGHPEFAVSHAFGGLAVQTAILGVADIAYRRANLEHAAASLQNLLQGALVITLIMLALATMLAPPFAFLGVHPVSIVLVAAYVIGMRMVHQTKGSPMWRPTETEETRFDVPSPLSREGSLFGLWSTFGLYAVIIGTAGWFVARTGVNLTQMTGLSETVVGGLFATLSTSMPELITAVAAVRQGALVLAVGNVLGGNLFDTLFLSMADVSYREGSVYHAATSKATFLAALSALMLIILMLGLLHRQKRGMGNIGFESVLILATYVGGFSIAFFL